MKWIVPALFAATALMFFVAAVAAFGVYYS
jgi:hypothetical protein